MSALAGPWQAFQSALVRGTSISRRSSPCLIERSRPGALLTLVNAARVFTRYRFLKT